MNRHFWDRLESRLLVLVLFVLLGASVITAALKIDASWQTPLIFLALLAILRLVTPVDEIHADVRYLRDVAGLSVQTYPTVDTFYADLRHAVDEAGMTLDLTHIRDQPPSDFTGSQPSEYFKQVLRFAETGEGRLVRRIISVRNDEMRVWAEDLDLHTRELRRYQIRVVDWSIAAPAVNMAIVDTRAAFLAVTGETIERTRGIAVEDERVAQYFVEYYNTLWRDAVPLHEFLEHHARAIGHETSEPSTSSIESTARGRGGQPAAEPQAVATPDGPGERAPTASDPGAAPNV